MSYHKFSCTPTINQQKPPHHVHLPPLTPFLISATQPLTQTATFNDNNHLRAGAATHTLPKSPPEAVISSNKREEIAPSRVSASVACMRTYERHNNISRGLPHQRWHEHNRRWRFERFTWVLMLVYGAGGWRHTKTSRIKHRRRLGLVSGGVYDWWLTKKVEFMLPPWQTHCSKIENCSSVVVVGWYSFFTWFVAQCEVNGVCACVVELFICFGSNAGMVVSSLCGG